MVETLSIAVIGASGVGKTSIIRRFVYDDFSETVPESQNPRIPKSKNPRIPESLKLRIPESPNPQIPEATVVFRSRSRD
ncbi:hypothetical protein QTP70_009106 [Hemibagrus guttatus]|uniref:Uncharacterized protein n=1 Tax=Hemibagrus guttatus TaxID=175788 RepID=A0AAE0UQV2_9TELE|nr:hypothetical protein QTP70_009106 [Hemibagrus guttatus]